MSFVSLYLILAAIVISLYVIGRYSFKLFEKYAVVDNESESRYTPPTANTRLIYNIGLLVIVFIILAIIN